ncbi:HVA22 DP1t-like protein [Tubulinosema ratisbonensis]|uniref:HVA22 DP1t-like protein n=1 Tax=Tubulinosema ratisbonensis TaxID=291195 RepID=A0A437AP64_9MICR|nr:HVA22 DP1t-like protein [Tubulinosema ratisbonensis]
MILKLLVNTLTLLLILHSAFNYHKFKKDIPELRKHYSYYFIIMCIFLGIDAELAFLTNFVPFYQAIKLFLVVWLTLPVFAAPGFIYKYYIGSIFKLYGERIDNSLINLKEKIRDFLGNTYEKTCQKIKRNRQLPMKENDENLSLKEIESNINVGDLSSNE